MDSQKLTSPFIAQKGKDTKGEIVLANMEFFPNVPLLDFQERYKVDNGHSEERQIQNLQNAMQRINRQLLDDMATESGTNWVCEKVRLGYFTLESVPAFQYGECSEKVTQYFTAIYALAKSKLVKKHRDTDTTRHGHDHADELEKTADDYLTESREALRLLMDKSRVTIDQV